MAGVKAHCASVKDYTGKLVKQGEKEPKHSLPASYGEATNHRTMRGRACCKLTHFIKREEKTSQRGGRFIYMRVHGQRHRKIPAADGGGDRERGDMLKAASVLEGNMGK